jgi:hypothetical protein
MPSMSESKLGTGSTWSAKSFFSRISFSSNHSVEPLLPVKITGGQSSRI